MKKVRLSLIFVLTVIFLSSCDVVDSKILEGARDYFPQAEAWKVRADTIQIETHVGNVSRKFVQETFRAMLAQKGGDIAQGFQVAGYRWLILGFDDYNAIWDMWQPQVFLVLNAQEMAGWCMRTWGYIPDQKTITVLK
jgi:hypothetical protein